MQTPAWSFPIEPHALLPFAHWLPPALRRPYWRLGAAGAWEDIALLRRAELVALFGEPVHAERLGRPGEELDRVARDRYLERLIHSPHDCEYGRSQGETWRGEEMANAGDVLEMEPLGCRVQLIRTAAETGGELVEFDVIGRPRGFLVQSHVHAGQARALRGHGAAP